jgi:predicted nucleic acid-binding protein
MKIVADACSVILLARATILEPLTKWHDLLMPRSVYDEVIAGKKEKLMDALLTERLCFEKKITVKESKNKELIEKMKCDFGLGSGEAETIAVSLEEKSAVLTDNRQGRKVSKIYGLPLLGSLEVVLSLYKNKKIGGKKALDALQKLKRFGWFDDYLIQHCILEVKND